VLKPTFYCTRGLYANHYSIDGMYHLHKMSETVLNIHWYKKQIWTIQLSMDAWNNTRELDMVVLCNQSMFDSYLLSGTLDTTLCDMFVGQFFARGLGFPLQIKLISMTRLKYCWKWYSTPVILTLWTLNIFLALVYAYRDIMRILINTALCQHQQRKHTKVLKHRRKK
jgi:hypothetical protein